jgi:hypothetical protein
MTGRRPNNHKVTMFLEEAGLDDTNNQTPTEPSYREWTTVARCVAGPSH